MTTRRGPLGLAALAAGLLAAQPAPAAAGEPAPSGAAVPRPSARTDCRYLVTEDRPAARGEGPYAPVPFPEDDIFRPLLADPKQPQFFAAYARVRFREPARAFDAASVGFGEYFGLWALRREGGCNGIQLGLGGGVFAQFDLDAPSSDLINSDYVVGLPVSLRRGAWSARLRLYHQSSHVGDEFLLGNPGFQRLNLSFEEAEAVASYERRRVRVYAGGGYLVHREPSALRQGKLQWGAELRGPGFVSPLSGPRLGEVRLAPVVGADFKAFEEQRWSVNTSVAAGLEWSSERSARRLRLLVTYFRGFNPYGQFFDQKTRAVGLGLYFAF